MTQRTPFGGLVAALTLVVSMGSAPHEIDRGDPSRELSPLILEKNLIRVVDGIAAATVRIETDDGMGSGTIISHDGVILTSAHVIEDSTGITVTLTDGRKFNAQTLGVNGAGDLALLKISIAGLTPVVLGDSDDLKRGQWVVAAGHPVSAFDDFQPTISVGMISKTDGVIRADERKIFRNAIVSDAPLSPGSSGGGLFDTKGRLIGTNAAVTRDERGAFSVRINEYKQDAERLLAGELFDRRPRWQRSRDKRSRGSRSRQNYFTQKLGYIFNRRRGRAVELFNDGGFSGIIADAKGRVLTVASRLAGLQPGDTVAAVTGDRERVDAEIISFDHTNGVAMLQLPTRAVPWQHFDLSHQPTLRRGQVALALGRRGVKGGIVGAPHRVPPLDMTSNVYYPDVVQIDTRLSKSELGTGVVDIAGDLLGLVVQHRLRLDPDRWSRDPFGAFLLPVKSLRESYELLSAGDGRAPRSVGFLGVELEEMTESEKGRRGVEGGVLVVNAQRGYPAERAGIRGRDVIVSIGGRRVNSRGSAILRIASFQRGKKVPVTVSRRGKEKTFAVTMAERSDF